MSKIRKIITAYALLIVSLFLCGCEVQIIEKPIEDSNKLTGLKNNELSLNHFYVKDGSLFYDTVNPQIQDNLLWLYGEDSNCPVLYRNEIIAFASKSTSGIKPLTIQKYEEIGYTFGMYGGSYKEATYVFAGGNTLNHSSASNIFSSDSVQVVSIDGKAISQTDIYKGLLVGYEPFSEHNIEFYIGSVYGNKTITANSKVCMPTKTVQIENYEKTKNGYIQFSMPNEMDSGYYFIQGQGFFIYIAEDKKTVTSIDVDSFSKINVRSEQIKLGLISEDETEPDPQKLNYQNFFVNVFEKQSNYIFTVDYKAEDTTPSILLRSPTGIIYSFTEEEAGRQSIMFTEVMPGEWEVIVNDPDTQVLNVSASKENEKEEVYEVVESFEVFTDLSSNRFHFDYDPTVTTIKMAYVRNNVTGEVYVMTPNTKSSYEKILNLMNTGTYDIIITCTTEDGISNIGMEDYTNYETETIVFD